MLSFDQELIEVRGAVDCLKMALGVLERREKEVKEMKRSSDMIDEVFKKEEQGTTTLPPHAPISDDLRMPNTAEHNLTPSGT